MATRQKRKTLSGTRSKVKFTKKKATSTDRTPSLRGKGLEHAVEQFQAEPDEKRSHEQWKRIESSVFGVQFKN